MTRSQAKSSVASTSWLPYVPLMAAGMLLGVAMIFGGSAKGKGDAVVHGVAVIAFAIVAMRWRLLELDGLQRATFWILIGGLILGALQLVPLTSGLFASLPQRAEILIEVRGTGLDQPWMPMTLDWWGTIRTMLALFGFLTMWMLCTSLPMDQRILLLKLAVVIAVPMALLGFAQASSKLDTTGANGLFENRNHYATLMAMVLPFAFASARQAQARNSRAAGVAWYSAIVLMLLAAALSFSRVGSALAMLSALASLWVLGKGKDHAYAPRRIALIPLSIAILAAGYFAADRLIQRFESDMFDDLRWQYVVNGWPVVKAYFPWGSGFGTFRAVYAQFEPLQALGEFTYANHAHNELLQNTIEGGVAALALMAAIVGVVVVAAARMARCRQEPDYWRRAALISVCVPLLHSLVDYPLRTLACSTLLALALAVLVSGRAVRGPTTGKSRQSALRLRQ